MRQLYVIHHCESLVPLGHAWVCGGEDGGACVEGADDSGLGDGEGLLLHDLMEDGTCAVRHLVKLVDAADAVIAQHQRSSVVWCDVGS